MTPTIKTVLSLIFAILLFSWILSLMPQGDGFEPTIPEIDQINYMHLSENTRDPKKENMETAAAADSLHAAIQKRLNKITNAPSNLLPDTVSEVKI